MKKKKEPCPNCGYCPECGRSNTTPLPVYPYPFTYPQYFGPWWQWTPTGPVWVSGTVTGTIINNPNTCSGTVTAMPLGNVTLT